MYPVCFLSLSLSHSCCYIPKSMPIHSSPLPSLFTPNPGSPPHCFLLTQLFLPPSLLLTPSSQHKLYTINYRPQDLPHHERMGVQVMMTVSPRLLTSFFSACYFVTMLTQCVTSRPTASVKSHCAHFWSNVSGVKQRNSCLEQSGKAVNGLDYSVTLLKRPRNVPNWLQ